MRDEILKMYQDKVLFAFALRMTKSHTTAHDLVQDTLVRILDKDKYQDQGSIVGYVKTVMKRIHLNNIRRVETTTRILDTYQQKYHRTAHDDAFNAVYANQVYQQAKYKEVLRLSALGYTAEDIGAILGVSPNTIFSQIRRNKQACRPYK